MYLLTRGADRSAPVLFWLHGGPGGAERPVFRYFNSELENHFVVVYWDQRGAGRSFDLKADPHRLTIASMSSTSTPSSIILDRALARTRSS
jgi:pimeloyl-ACP methyl ester carboxylesterase